MRPMVMTQRRVLGHAQVVQVGFRDPEDEHTTIQTHKHTRVLARLCVLTLHPNIFTRMTIQYTPRRAHSLSLSLSLARARFLSLSHARN